MGGHLALLMLQSLSPNPTGCSLPLPPRMTPIMRGSNGQFGQNNIGMNEFLVFGVLVAGEQHKTVFIKQITSAPVAAIVQTSNMAELGDQCVIKELKSILKLLNLFK